MTLDKWLKDNDISIHTAAKYLGCSVFAVRKWVRGERIPRPKMQVKIYKMTTGKVDPNEWINV